MLPTTPALGSTTIAWPRPFAISSAVIRARTSTLPPGGKPCSSLMRWEGYPGRRRRCYDHQGENRKGGSCVAQAHARPPLDPVSCLFWSAPGAGTAQRFLGNYTARIYRRSSETKTPLMASKPSRRSVGAVRSLDTHRSILAAAREILTKAGTPGSPSRRWRAVPAPASRRSIDGGRVGPPSSWKSTRRSVRRR